MKTITVEGMQLVETRTPADVGVDVDTLVISRPEVEGDSQTFSADNPIESAIGGIIANGFIDSHMRRHPDEDATVYCLPAPNEKYKAYRYMEVTDPAGRRITLVSYMLNS